MAGSSMDTPMITISWRRSPKGATKSFTTCVVVDEDEERTRGRRVWGDERGDERGGGEGGSEGGDGMGIEEEEEEEEEEEAHEEEEASTRWFNKSYDH